MPLLLRFISARVFEDCKKDKKLKPFGYFWLLYKCREKTNTQTCSSWKRKASWETSNQRKTLGEFLEQTEADEEVFFFWHSFCVYILIMSAIFLSLS